MVRLVAEYKGQDRTLIESSERKKATRHLRQCEKRLASTEPEDAAYGKLKEATHAARVDLNYTLYFPLMKKYQSLFHKHDVSEATEDATELSDGQDTSKKPEVWYEIEKAMQNGGLETIRERRERPLRTKVPSLKQPRAAHDSRPVSLGQNPPKRLADAGGNPLPDDGNDGKEDHSDESEGFFEE